MAFVEEVELSVIKIGRLMTLTGIVAALVLLLALAGFDGFDSRTVFPKDSGKSVVALDLTDDEFLIIRFEIKAMKDNSAYLTLERDGVEVFRLGEDWGLTKREASVTFNGQYDLKVYFSNSSADRRTAEVKVNWKLEARPK